MTFTWSRAGSLFTNCSFDPPGRWAEPRGVSQPRNSSCAPSSLYRRTRSAFLGGDVLCVDRAGRNSDEMRAVKRDTGHTWSNLSDLPIRGQEQK